MANPPTASQDEGGRSFPLIRRLLAEHARRPCRRYAAALALMAISAGRHGRLGGAAAARRQRHDGHQRRRARRLQACCASSPSRWRCSTSCAASRPSASSILMSRTGNRIVAALQARVYDHLLHQPVAFFSDRHSSELMARLAMAANGVRDVVQFVDQLGRAATSLTVIGLAGVMVYNDPLMALLALSIMPVGALLLGRADEAGAPRSRAAPSTARPASCSTCRRPCRASASSSRFNLEGVMRGPHGGGRSARSRRPPTAWRSASRMSSPVSETLGGVAVAMHHPLRRLAVAVAHADPGSFFAFMGAMLSAYEPAKRLGRLNLDLQNGLVSARLIYDLLDEPLPDADGRDAGPTCVPGPGRIAFEGVSLPLSARASGCSTASTSWPSPTRPPRWSAPRAAASRPSSA